MFIIINVSCTDQMKCILHDRDQSHSCHNSCYFGVWLEEMEVIDHYQRDQQYQWNQKYPIFAVRIFAKVESYLEELSEKYNIRSTNSYLQHHYKQIVCSSGIYSHCFLKQFT